MTAFGRFAASLAGLAWHARSLALERFQNECLVAFDDAGQFFGLIAGQGSQKPVSPAKRRRIMHAAPPCGFRSAHPLDHRLGLRRPFVLHAQIRQRRFRQGVERAPAVIPPLGVFPVHSKCWTKAFSSSRVRRADGNDSGLMQELRLRPGLPQEAITESRRCGGGGGCFRRCGGPILFVTQEESADVRDHGRKGSGCPASGNEAATPLYRIRPDYHRVDAGTPPAVLGHHHIRPAIPFIDA